MKIGTEIDLAAQIIKNGGLVAFPTETVYGLGADAMNPLAVAKIFEVKQRPYFDPLIVHISNITDIEKLTEYKNPYINLISKKFWPGPLTIVVPKKESVPQIVTAGLNTIGIRMPDNHMALELIAKAQTPIAAPSANKFGYLSPTMPQHIIKQNLNIDYIIDGGKCKIGVESTVIRLLDDGFVILRNGAITEEMLLSVLPKSKIDVLSIKKQSPGHMPSHYSPNKPLYIVGNLPNNLDIKQCVYISYVKRNDIEGYKYVDYLSEKGNLLEAANRFFQLLHYYEETDAHAIVIEPVPEESLGKAIMERMRKAAYRFLL